MNRNNPNRQLVFWVALVATAALILGSTGGPAAAQTGPRTFPETGQTVQGQFLAYWEAHGGLAQQGYPISGEMTERNDTDGQTYTVQYFERAVFERHPANAPPYDVLLSLLGVSLYTQKYAGNAPGQTPNTAAGSRLFPETGKRVGGAFLAYWTAHGGLAQQGFPISDEFSEVSDLNGQTYTVQYFERAVFERHPENAPPYDVLLAQLGTLRYRAGSAPPAATPPAVLPTAEPPAPPQAQAIPQTEEFALVRARFENMTREQYRAAGYTLTTAACTSAPFWFTPYATSPDRLADAAAGKPMDPQQPVALLLTGNLQRVVGLEWEMEETKENAQPPPVLFGQLVPRHFGYVAAPFYQLTAYFKPNGYVLFARFDPDYKCNAP
jgi:hypothetical protein